jgi:hypothetical protein
MRSVAATTNIAIRAEYILVVKANVVEDALAVFWTFGFPLAIFDGLSEVERIDPRFHQ